MPSRNTVREFGENNFYHIYNRGVEKRDIFLDEEDYTVMLNLMARHLRPKPDADLYGREYKSFSTEVELLAYCLMPNHFHFLVYLKDSSGVTRWMRSVMTAYVGYFNKKYDRVGPLFQGNYKASLIKNESYLWHISRYIHLNPSRTKLGWQNYKYSSTDYYLGQKQANWINPKRILEMHQDYGDDYNRFLHDYDDYKKSQEELNLSF